MKKFLVPTDFSETAANAISYAAKLAQFTGSKLVLFHANYVPMLVSEVPFALTSEDLQLEERSDEQLGLIIDGLRKKYGEELDVEHLSLSGFPSYEIADIAKEKNCDLIIMGTSGALGTHFMGNSNTVDVIKKTQCHVLVIPDKTIFQKPDKIVFAFDYKPVVDKIVFNPLLELASLFNSEIMIFNMEDSRVHPKLVKEIEGIKLDHVFEDIKHTYWFSKHENVVDAINEFADDRQAVMITLIRRSHNMFQRMITKSNTKHMALDTQLPLLILHEQ